MCGCNKNRGIRSPISQVNPVYKPNALNFPQKQLALPAQRSVQIQTTNKQVTTPVQTLNQAVKPLNIVPTIIQQTSNPSITQKNDILTVNQNKLPLPVYNSAKNNLILPPQIPIRAPIAPLRTPYIPIRAHVKVPVVQSTPTNVPVRTPYVPNQNKPVVQSPNIPKPVNNTTITRNVRLSIPAQPASIPKPTNMQPNQQTLLANRISAANRKRV